jgi:hypothetical protein
MNAEQHYDLFLSYNSLDYAIVTRIASKLRSRGLSIFLDRWYLDAGRPWVSALEDVLSRCGSVAVFVGSHGMGNWQQRERDFALNRQAESKHFKVIPVLLPGANTALGLLSLNTWVDLSTTNESEALDILEWAIRGRTEDRELVATISQTVSSVCPYRGMQVFREEDAPFFFGRQMFIATLKDMVSSHSFVGVLGASGSGKSSVVRAGLASALRKDDDQVWEICTLVPGDRPLGRLASALLPLLQPDISMVDQLVETDKLTTYLEHGANEPMRTLIDKIIDQQQGTERLLIVVDQLEEVYTLATQPDCTRFIDLLLGSATYDRCRVVVTLRADFFGHVLKSRVLSDTLQNAILNLGPLTQSELREVIVNPVQAVDLKFEPGLVERILEDVGDEPGNLPLLEFVLKELWEQRQDRVFTHQSYDAIGRIQGAIATRANREYEKMDASSQDALRQLFINHLIHVDDEQQYTRRRGSRDSIPDNQWGLAQSWSEPKLRLIVSAFDPSTGQQTAEVAHEAILVHWDRLRMWLRHDLEFILWRERTRVLSALWERTGEDAGSLLKGITLAESERWYQTRKEDCTGLRRFIDASLKARNEEQQRENTRRKRFFRVITAALVLVSVGIVKLSEFDQKRGQTRIHNSLIVQDSGYWPETENHPNLT